MYQVYFASFKNLRAVRQLQPPPPPYGGMSAEAPIPQNPYTVFLKIRKK